METFEEKLVQFNALAANPIDEFWRLLGTGVSEEEGEDAAEQLRGLISCVQSLAEAAANAGLQGLESILALLESNLHAVESEARELNAAERNLLEAWPVMLMGYVVGQGNSNVVDQFFRNLSTPGWLAAISEDDMEILRQMLLQESAVSTECISHSETAQKTDMEAEAGTGQFQSANDPVLVVEADTPPLLILEEPDPVEMLPQVSQQVESEMLEMLAGEFPQIAEQMKEDLSAAVSGHFSAGERQQALSNYSELIERLALASESVGLITLSRVLLQLKRKLEKIEGDLSAGQSNLLASLPDRIAAYFAWPADTDTATFVVGLLTDETWQKPMSVELAQSWVVSLTGVEQVQVASDSTERQTEATVEDVSLELPEDINQELLDGLLQELPLQTAAFTAAIERLSAGVGAASDVSRAMRSAHTLKGAANTVGVRGIANLTHHLEDILVALSEAELVPNRELSSILINAGDCLEGMSEALMGTGPKPEQSLEVFQQVLDYANRIDREGAHELGAVAVATVEREMPESNRDEHVVENRDGVIQEKGQGLRVSAPVVDELLRLAGETLISNSQIQDRLNQTMKQSEAMRQQQHLITQLISELEHLVDIRGIAAPKNSGGDNEEFDPLEFETFSELHTVTRRLIEASSDSQQIMGQVNEQLGELDDLLDIQHRLQIANQHAVIRTRMVPVSSVVSRLQRSVRQTCRLLDKQAELNISGDATNIDSNVLTDLMDPLMHILRNAVDHGIDDPEARLAAGKSPVGRIDLSFAREGNSIVVRCKDDGAGLDYDSIRRIAQSKGMITQERDPSTEELARLILVNGFSTRDETTQVSGRGVGMDIVYNRVLQMKGTLALDSVSGQGLTVELRLPATLLSAHTLIVRHGSELLAVSTRGVEDIHYLMPEQIEHIGNHPVYRVGNAVHSLLKLENLMALPPDRREEDRLGFPVLLTRMDDGSMNAILVQEVLDDREVVLKKFGKYVPGIQGMIGAVILGDGTVAPVIDLVELLRVPIHRELSDQIEEGDARIELQPDSPDVHTALVVDDSLTARRAAAKVMKDAGYNVRTAMDGLDAVSILQNFIPDILLVDMEMPRMNGLELTSHIRNAERTRNVPVIMITSRSTEKHRQQGMAAGVNVYLTKPFSDEKLIDHVVRLTGQAA